MATVKISRGSSSVQATVNIKLLAVVLSGKVTVESRLEKVGELPEIMQHVIFKKKLSWRNPRWKWVTVVENEWQWVAMTDSEYQWVTVGISQWQWVTFTGAQRDADGVLLPCVCGLWPPVVGVPHRLSPDTSAVGVTIICVTLYTVWYHGLPRGETKKKAKGLFVFRLR